MLNRIFYNLLDREDFINLLSSWNTQMFLILLNLAALSVLIYKNKIEVSLFIYRKYKALKSIFEKKSHDFIELFHFDDINEVFHFTGYLNGKIHKIEPDQIAVDREISLTINDKKIPSLSGIDFKGSSKYNSSTTFIFTYPHIVTHEDETLLKVQCLITDDIKEKKFSKGEHIDLKKEIEKLLD